MSYRFLKLTSSYSQYIDQFTRKNPDLPALSYDQAFDRFVNDYFYIRTAEYLKELGNETRTYNVVIRALQEKWARENNIDYSRQNWLKDIVLKQVKLFNPDVIYLDDLYLFDRNFRQEIREQCDRTVYLVGWRSAPTPDFSVFNDMDLMLSSSPLFVQLMIDVKINAHHMPFGFEESILSKVPELPRDIDFSFLGSIGYKSGIFKDRYAYITRLLKSTPLEIWGDYFPDSLLLSGSYSQNKYFRRVYSTINNLQISVFPNSKQTLLSHRIHKSVFGKDYFSILAQSKMTFNCHIDCSEQYAANVRLFEATGMGTCLITDWKQNITDFFEPGTEIITYRNADDCIEKALYYLKNDDERESIAKAGQIRTLKDHTMAKRMVEMNKIILELLK